MAVTWTEEQQKVISLRNRNILVSAAAGSGKTAVLVERILSKILDREHPVDVDRLLIMTFTRAAAGEMKERLSAALEKALYEDPDNAHLQKQMTLIHTAQITTIDGFCSYIIRNYFHMIGLDPGYRTAEEGELKLLREDVVKEVLEDAYEKKEEKFLRLVECYAPGKTDEGLKDLILKVYEAAMSHPFPEEWLENCLQAYQVDNPEQIYQSRWVTVLWNEMEENVQEAEHLIQKARSVCLEEDGPLPYLDALDSDLGMVSVLKKTIKERDYRKLKQMAEELSFQALSRKKASDVDPAKKDWVKNLRDEEKGILKELIEKYLYWDEDELLDMVNLCRTPLESLVELVKEFQERFAQKKREKNILDFTDMEHFALHILAEKEGDQIIPGQAARELSEKYEEVMIDEYQDSNSVQEMITTLVSGWAGKRKNIFMVGDVKQSIYRFRLARPELFMEKYHNYSTSDSPEQRIDLHKNFRSRHQVLTSVNYIFNRIMGAEVGGIDYDSSNALYPGAVFPEGPDESFYTTEVLLVEKDGEELEEESGNQTDRELEALAIAGEISRIVGKEQIFDKETGTYRPVEYGDIVILLRSAYGWAETFREVLISRGIPAYTSSRTGYFSAQEVVNLLNYLRICDNPLQDIPLTGVLHSPMAGCSTQELGELRKACPKGLIYECICQFVERESFETEEEEKLRDKLAGFLEQLREIRDMSAYTPVHQLILHILKVTGYEDYVRALPGGSQRGANLRMLVEKAMDYEKTSYRGLFNFVRYIENLQKYEVDFGEVNVIDAGKGSVQIMTVHKSKGLEFPVVFAAGMGKQFNFQDINARFLIHPDLGFGTDVILPEKRLMASTPQKQVIRNVQKRESLGEELRVLYVALTRAKEKLYITGTIGGLKEKILSLWNWKEDAVFRIPTGKRIRAKTFWDYILPALSLHPAMKELYMEYIFCTETQEGWCDGKTDFIVRKITAADLIQNEIVDMTEQQIREQVLKNWDSSKIYDQQIHDILEKRFDFRYPYRYLEEMPVKVSVSDLKKRSWQDEMELEENTLAEPDIVPLIPRFISEESQSCQGAARGTAYHRVMECLDYKRTGSYEEIREQLLRLKEQKKLTEEEASSIYIKDILKFAASDLGQRMKTAAEKGCLFREQPFVIAVEASELDELWDGEEKILVQGIIDSYFLEEDEIVLVDYKTDRVQEGEEPLLIARYRSQLKDYARALQRMRKKKVKECLIYSFALDKAIQVR